MEGSKSKHLVYEPAGKVADKRNPVIFLHAMLCSKEIWTDFLQRIATETGRTVYAYDARCHGENKDLNDFTFEVLVEDLYNFMSELKMEKAVLVGHSMGGKTAISVALKNPEKVEKVLIVDMYVKEIPEELVKRSIKFLGLWRDAVKTFPASASFEEITKQSVPAMYKQLKDEEQMESEKQAFMNSKFVYTKTEDGKCDVSYNASEIQKGLEKYLAEKEKLSGEYAGPAYFLYGTESPYKVNEDEANIVKYFPKAEMIPFQGSPHHIFAHSPDEFVNVLVQKINLPLA